MKLESLISEDMIFLNKDVGTKPAAISLLLKEIFQKLPLKLEAKTIESAVFARESLGGTSFPTGIAVPHARLEGFNDLVLAVLVPKVPIPDPVSPIRVLVLMLTGLAKPTLYLNTLASLLKLSQNKILFDKLAGTTHPTEALEFIKQGDFTVKKEVMVEDIMSHQVMTVGPDTTMKTLADIFYQHNFSYVPVVNEDSEVVGEVSLLDIFKSGYPDYAVMTGSLKFLSSFEPFEILLQNEEKILVRDIMKPVSFSCAPTAAVVEIGFELLQKKRRHVLVLNGKKVVGILSIMDILKKVIRG